MIAGTPLSDESPLIVGIASPPCVRPAPLGRTTIRFAREGGAVTGGTRGDGSTQCRPKWIYAARRSRKRPVVAKRAASATTSSDGRGGGIRTHSLVLPKHVRHRCATPRRLGWYGA